VRPERVAGGRTGTPELPLGHGTVRRRIRDICDRLGVDAPIHAAVRAARRGLL